MASRRTTAERSLIPVMLNPEFTREGRAVRDYQQPDRIVLGVVSDPDGHGEAALRELYHSAAAPIVVMGAIDAAITKLGANLFLATKISFANELAEICDAFGADVATVVDGMSYDSRIGGSFLRAGVGFGGSCLPNQVSMTIRTAAQAGVDTPLLTAVDEVNHRRRSQVVERAASLLDGTVRGRRVALLGLTFKPDTDDLRDAPALTIAERAAGAGRDGRRLRPDALRPRAIRRSGAWARGRERGRRRDARRRHRHPRDRVAGIRRLRLGGRRRDHAPPGRDRRAQRPQRRASWQPHGFTYTSFGRGTVVPDDVAAGTVAATGSLTSLQWGRG